MNNAVSADVTLFSRVHPDIVKRISVSSVIVSALLAIGGIGAFVTSLRMGDATSTMSMVFMVTPHVGVWIETQSPQHFGLPNISHTSCRCVD